MLDHESELDHRMSKSLEEMAQDLFKSVVGGFSVFVPSDGLTGAHAEQAEGPSPTPGKTSRNGAIGLLSVKSRAEDGAGEV